MNAVHRIRREYNETFADTVKSFAVMGYSCKATAGILEICPSYFRCLCKVYNLMQYFKTGKDLSSSCKPPGRSDNRPKQYSDEYLLSILRGYSIKINTDRYNYLQCRPSGDTIIRRFGSWRKAKKLAHKAVPA